MSSVQDHISSRLEQVVTMEKAILGRIEAAADDLMRTEELDEEQLAEIHTILQALRHEGESHAAMVERLARRLGREGHDA